MRHWRRKQLSHGISRKKHHCLTRLSLHTERSHNQMMKRQTTVRTGDIVKRSRHSDKWFPHNFQWCIPKSHGKHDCNRQGKKPHAGRVQKFECNESTRIMMQDDDHHTPLAVIIIGNALYSVEFVNLRRRRERFVLSRISLNLIPQWLLQVQLCVFVLVIVSVGWAPKES